MGGRRTGKRVIQTIQNYISGTDLFLFTDMFHRYKFIVSTSFKVCALLLLNCFGYENHAVLDNKNETEKLRIVSR